MPSVNACRMLRLKSSRRSSRPPPRYSESRSPPGSIPRGSDFEPDPRLRARDFAAPAAWWVMEPPLRLWRHGAALVFERDLDQQRGALAGGAGDLERAAERFDSIAEPEQSGPPAGVGSPDPVVADRQPQDRVVCVEVDVHDGRVRVLGDVGQP